MSKKNRLLKNLGFITIGNLSVKIISFLLVPLLTSILSPEEYGIYELVVTTTCLLVPILTLDIADSSLRFSMEPNVNKREVYRISIKYCFVGLLSVVLLLTINHFYTFAFFLVGNEIIFALMFFGTSMVGVLLAYSKGVDRVKEAAVSGIIGAFVSVALDVIFLVPCQMGVRGYFYATIVGYTVQIIYLFFSLKGSHPNYNEKSHIESALLKYSVPLIANNTAWWINSALDRYIVTYFKGVSENGVYSVGYKIPTIINTVQSLFHQAWTLSAIQEYDTEEANKYFCEIYQKYNFFLVGICGILLTFSKFFARFVYAKEFYVAWRYVPFLCIGFVFLGLANYIGGIFNALKKPRIIASTTIIGALINCVLNFYLIPFIGVIGAAIATCASYLVIWVFRMVVVRSLIGVSFFSPRDLVAYVVLILGALYTINDKPILNYVKIVAFATLFILYKAEIFEYINRIETYMERLKNDK